MRARTAGFVWSAVLCLGSLAVPARAARFELAEEWPAVSFQDGDRTQTLFIHMADFDVPAFDIVAKLKARDLYVPLYQIRLKEVRRKDDRPDGDVASLSLESLSTGYRLYIRNDRNGQHVIRRDPDFQTSAGKDLLGLLSVFHLRSARPRNVLVMVRPGQPEVAQNDSLDEVESAAIDSMDASERASAVEDCRGEPGAPGSNPCWRAAARRLLSMHAGARPSAEQELSPFEQRYLKQRLSAKGYAQYQKAMELPAGHPDKTALLSDWRESILSLDVEEHLTAPSPAKNESSSAPHQAAVVATTTTAPSPVPAAPPSPAAVEAPTSRTRFENAPAVSEVPPVPAGRISLPPAPAARRQPPPSSLPFRRLLLGLVILFVVIFTLVRRKRGR
jgi:hypothetical protein